MVDLVPGRSTLWSTPRSTWPMAGVFPPCLLRGLNSNFELFLSLKIPETSEGHISLIQTPILENSDSFPSRILRRTQWRNPFPLILILKFNSALIYGFNMLLKFGLLHSPLLKGFRPRNLQVKKNVSYHPIVHLLNHQSQASIVLKRFLMLYEHMQRVCVYVPYLIQMIRPD